MCLSFDPRIGSNRHKFKTPLLLSKIVVGWTSGSCIQALWRGSKRAFSRRGFGVFRAKGERELSPPRRMERSGTLGVALYLNRRLRSQAIHDLNAVNGHCLRFKCRATTIDGSKDRRAAMRPIVALRKCDGQGARRQKLYRRVLGLPQLRRPALTE